MSSKGAYSYYAPIGVTSQSTASQVVDAAESHVAYHWVSYAATTYTPVNQGGYWHYTLHKHFSNNANYTLFEAFDIEHGIIYRYSKGANKWYKFTGTAV